MSQAIQNRFSPSKFDNATATFVGEGKQLTARYACQGRAWKATIQWKPGYEKDFTSLTTLDEAAMKSALLRLDSTVRFLGQVNTAPAAPVQTLADKNAEMLEAMRLDTATVSDKAYLSACRMYKQQPKSRTAPSDLRTQDGRELSFTDAKMLEDMRLTPAVSDNAYRNACAKLGVPPRPRPAKAVTPTTHAIVPFHVQGEAYGNFVQAHGELYNGIFAEQNATIIANWMRDNSRQCDAASLDQCYRECSQLGYFRDARVLTRGMGNDFRVVRPYNHAELVAVRKQQVVDAASAPPTHLSQVDADVWRAVNRAYPQLPVNSAAFKKCCADTLVLWATNFAKEQDPSLAAANKKGELRAAADKVLAAWVRQGNSKLKLGGKGSVKLWLD